jgi:hypothetical protein
MFENRLLRRIFGPNSDEVTGQWRKLHNEELCDFVPFAKYNDNNQVEKDEMGGPCSAKGGEEERV